MMRFLAEPIITQVAISAFSGSAFASETTSIRLSGRPAARPKITGVVSGRFLRRQSKARPSCHGLRPRRSGCEKAMTKPAAQRRVEPLFDQFPRFQIVGQRDGAENAPQRRADPRGDSSIAVTPGTMVTSIFSPLRRTGLDRLADGGGHGEDAGITARDDRDSFPPGGLCQRGICAGNFLAVVGGTFIRSAVFQPVTYGP